MASPVQMKTLLEAGVHFGHQTRRWDPRMRPFIFTERNGIHIIDLQQTVRRLEEAMVYVRDIAANDGTIMFVGTKKQAQETIEEEAGRCGMPYVSQRWMGGMLTNFQTIQGRVRRLHELEMRRDRGEFEQLPKKEAAKLLEQLAKLNRLLGGMRDLARLPSAIFVVDPHREENAVREARRLEIPIVAMVDTNCNPDVIDKPIPANDDAIRAIRLLTGKIADAVIDGRQQREAILAPEAPEEEEGEVADVEVIVDVAAFSDVEAAMLRAAGEAGDGQQVGEDTGTEQEEVVAVEPDIEAVLASIPPLEEDEDSRRARRKTRRRAEAPAGDEEEPD